MRVLLVGPDSKIPNLALMKIAAYHKAKGDTVSYNVDDPDIIYLSIIFNKTKIIVNSIKAMYPNAKIIVGGPGYDPKVKLPIEIEQTPPLQIPNLYSIARITSGCIRKCPWCMVHIQEPEGIRYIMSPELQWKKGTILRILDDNILALPKAFDDLYNFCKVNDINLHMENYDIRLVTPEIAKKISELKHHSGIWFSFDTSSIENSLRKGIKNLIDAGIKPYKLRCFIYCHDESQINDAKYRWTILREYGVTPFLMVNMDNRTTRLRKIQRRACRPAIYRNLTPDQVFE